MDSANNIGTIAWGSNASGGDVSVSSLYDLREVLDRIGAALNFLTTRWHDERQRKRYCLFFEFDSQDNLARSKYLRQC